MMMNEAQKVAFDACRKIRVRFFQDEIGSDEIRFDEDDEEEEHEFLVELVPFVNRLIVIQDNSGYIRRFGFECKFPVGHFTGLVAGRWYNPPAELVEVLGLLASEYGIRFERVVSEQAIEREEQESE